MIAIVKSTIIKTLLVTNGVLIVEISEKEIKSQYIEYYFPKHTTYMFIFKTTKTIVMAILKI